MRVSNRVLRRTVLHRAVLVLIAGAVACGGAPTLLEFHRTALEGQAQGALDCEFYEVADATPEDFPSVAGDPQARRYLVTGCEREAAFVCFSLAHGHGTEAPECRPLNRGDGHAGGGVYIGQHRVR